jgi:hypothetical protein
VELEQARAREQELEAEKNALETDLADLNGVYDSFMESCGIDENSFSGTVMASIAVKEPGVKLGTSKLMAGGHGSFIEDLCGVVDLYDEGKEDLCSSDRGSETSSSFSYDSGFEMD